MVGGKVVEGCDLGVEEAAIVVVMCVVMCVGVG